MPQAKAGFVGSSQCKECHALAYQQWQTSHHAKAMSVATDSTVLGNFNNASFSSQGIEHKFYKRNMRFYIFTCGKGGEMKEYEITHTFGYTPLQQYLVPIGRGKYQCLPIAWDTEKQQWFDMGHMVYGNQDIHHNDWLYWTNQGQNWNGMCAECHSTNVKKNYMFESDSFHTTWSEINVSCEACHGPGSDHINWAALPSEKQKTIPNAGLLVQSSGINNQAYVNLCARCHARRIQLGNYNHKYGHIMDFMIPGLLHDDYFVDGQILNEDYVWGSFTQSKMYHADIKCNDCHNVHSGETLLQGNQLCFQCHQQGYYGSSRHHFHKTVNDAHKPYTINGRVTMPGEGAQCISCHMPGRYYMGIDYRHDHSIRIPRPDLSKELGVPNACNQCHTDKSTDWAISYTRQWYGIKNRPHYGRILNAGRNNKPEAITELVKLVNNDLSPLIVRATALDLLSGYSDTTVGKVIKQYLEAPEDMLRYIAVQNYPMDNMPEFINSIAPLLIDPARAVRIEAARKFSLLPENLISSKYTEAYHNALDEYINQQQYMADFPGGSSNLGLLYLNQGNYTKAEAYYKRATETDSQYYPAFYNLAMVYNHLGKNMEAVSLYKHLLRNNPEMAEAHYFLGLLLVELEQYNEAIEQLKLAARKMPSNSRVNYNLGLLYSKKGKFSNAIAQLKLALEKESHNFEYQYALAHVYYSAHKHVMARDFINKTLEKYPENNALRQLVKANEKQ